LSISKERRPPEKSPVALAEKGRILQLTFRKIPEKKNFFLGKGKSGTARGGVPTKLISQRRETFNTAHSKGEEGGGLREVP